MRKNKGSMLTTTTKLIACPFVPRQVFKGGDIQFIISTSGLAKPLACTHCVCETHQMWCGVVWCGVIEETNLHRSAKNKQTRIRDHSKKISSDIVASFPMKCGLRSSSHRMVCPADSQRPIN